MTAPCYIIARQFAILKLQAILYKAAQYRAWVAVDLANAGRLADAREYARAALRNFESFGNRAAEMIEKTRGLVAAIEAAMKGAGGAGGAV